MARHLAIFKSNSANDILIGKRKVDVRFSRSRIAPFGLVKSGDQVLVKKSGGKIVGSFVVKKVIYYDNLDETDFDRIKKEFSCEEVSKDEPPKFVTIIFIGNVTTFLFPPQISKRDRRSWLVLP